MVRHTGRVLDVKVSPDGRSLASVSLDGTAKLWDLSSGVATRAFVGHAHGVGGVAFSPDGATLATAGWDHTVRLWDVATAAPIRTLTSHTRPVQLVAFSPDGARLASADWDGTLRVWDVAAGVQLHALSHPEVEHVAFSSDGKRLVSGDDEGHIRLWSLETGRLLEEEEGRMSAASGPQGEWLAVAGPDGRVTVRRVGSSEVQGAFQGELHGRRLALSRDGRRVASVGYDSERRVYRLEVWDVDTGRLLRTVATHREAINAVSFTADGGRLATASDDQTIAVWDVETGEAVPAFGGHRAAVRCVAFGPGGTRVVSSGKDWTLRAWEPGTAEALATTTGVRGLALAPGATRVAAWSGDRLEVWDVAAGKPLATTQPLQTGILQATFSADGGRVATLADEGPIEVWDAGTGARVEALPAFGGDFRGLAFSPDGSLLGGAAMDGSAHVWRLGAGKRVEGYGEEARWARLVGDPDRPRGIAFSPDGRLLAAADGDRAFRLWDRATGQEVRTFAGHEDY
ncbi:MAG: WD40 repeat domain-containing protein, partial [Candidatus Sericytochromatia bacterium]|nr:WD40 repeat domain-containing protein [Candidatus Sericytochromatia bacterium]